MNISLGQSEIRTYSNNTELINKRRLQILQGAIGVFLKKGFKATTLRDISLATGISIGNIYRYIGSKNDLLHILCQTRANSREGLEKIAEENKDLNNTDLLKESIRYHFSVGDQSRTYNLFFTREISHFSKEDRRMLLDSAVQIVDYFKGLLDKGNSSGEFQIRSTRAVAHNILMLGHDWGLRRWYLSQFFTLEEYIDIHTELILKQILPGIPTTHVKRQNRDVALVKPPTSK